MKKQSICFALMNDDGNIVAEIVFAFKIYKLILQLDFSFYKKINCNYSNLKHF